jgi:hypothetical protein
MLSLTCWIIGDPPNQVFNVAVPTSGNVSALKDAIKKYLGVEFRPASKHLEIWPVAIPFVSRGNADVTKAEQAAKAKAEAGGRLLRNVGLFESVDEGHLHIVVKKGGGTRRLFLLSSPSDGLISISTLMGYPFSHRSVLRRTILTSTIQLHDNPPLMPIQFPRSHFHHASHLSNQLYSRTCASSGLSNWLSIGSPRQLWRRFLTPNRAFDVSLPSTVAVTYHTHTSLFSTAQYHNRRTFAWLTPITLRSSSVHHHPTPIAPIANGVMNPPW